jgi:hypothetical protein
MNKIRVSKPNLRLNINKMVFIKNSVPAPLLVVTWLFANLVNIAQSSYWTNMQVVNQNYGETTWNMEYPSAGYHYIPVLNIEHTIVAYSSRGDDAQAKNGKLIVRDLTYNPWNWGNNLQNEAEVIVYEASVALNRGIQSSIACDNIGNWVIAFSVDSNNNGDTDIYFVRSTTNGNNWSSFNRLDISGPNGFSDSDPCILYDNRTNIWYAAWLSASDRDGAGTDVDVAFCQSSDGQNWTSPKWVNPGATVDSVDESNVRLVLGMNGTTPVIHILYFSKYHHNITGTGNDGDIFIVTTVDGLAFHGARLLQPATMADPSNTETEISFDVSSDLRGQHIAVVYRVTNDLSNERDIRACQSSNGGVNFSLPETLQAFLHEAETEIPPSVKTDNRGLFLVVFGTRKEWSRSRAMDIDDTVGSMVYSTDDIDIFFSYASTSQSGDPGTGWTEPMLINENNARSPYYGNSDFPILVQDEQEHWAVFFTSDQQYSSDGTTYYSLFRNVFYSHFNALNEKICYNNGPGLNSYCVKALQARVNELPENMTLPQSLSVVLDFWFGGDDLTDLSTRFVKIDKGRKIHINAPTTKHFLTVREWGVQKCAFPMFVIEDEYSSLKFEPGLDFAWYSIDTHFIVLNKGNSAQIYVHYDPQNGYKHCDNTDIRSGCPLGFRPPEVDDIQYYPKYCVPCPAGKECGDVYHFLNSSSPDIPCPAGSYCPAGTFNSKLTKCAEYRYYTSMDTGLSTKHGCAMHGTPCEYGYWCAPGTLLSEHIPILNEQSCQLKSISVVETLVYPSSKKVAFNIARGAEEILPLAFPGLDVCHVPTDACSSVGNGACMDLKGECGWDSWWHCQLNRVIVDPSTNHCQKFLELKLDVDTPDWLADYYRSVEDIDNKGFTYLPKPNASVNFELELFAQSQGFSISDTLTYNGQLQFFALWATFPYSVPVLRPIPITVVRSVTTVIFNPAEEIILKTRLDMKNFTTDATMFNIGCNDAVTWGAKMWDCSYNPSNPYEEDIDSHPVSWIETVTGFKEGFIAVGVTDPAILRVRVFPTKVDPSHAERVLGFKNYRACLRVTFNMASAANVELKKDLKVILSTYEDCPPGYYSDLGTSENGACNPCEPGTYADVPGSTTCKSCPESFPRSAVGAKSLHECKSAPGYFRDADGNSGQCVKLGPGVNCLDEGLTLETVPLLPGYWRSHNRSKTILRCPNPIYCVGSSPKNGGSSSRRELSLVEDSSYCLPHHRGPFCQVCELGYVKRGLAPCGYCDAASFVGDQQRLGWTILAAALIIFFAFLLTQRQALRKFAKHRAESVIAIGKKINARASIANVLFQGEGSGVNQRQVSTASSATIIRVKHPPKHLSKIRSSNTHLAVSASSDDINNAPGNSTREAFARNMSRRLKPIAIKIDKNTSLLWGIVVSIEASTTVRILISLFQVIGGISKNFGDIYPEIFAKIASAFTALSAEFFYNLDFACVILTNHYLSLVLNMIAPLLVSCFQFECPKNMYD